MSNDPERIAIMEIDLGISILNLWEKILPAKDNVINAGKVPNPNSIIKNAPSTGFASATAPAAAT